MSFIYHFIKNNMPDRVFNGYWYRLTCKKYPYRISDKMLDAVSERYLESMGRPLDLDDPKSFTEKIQWYKLYYDHPDVANCLCKYRFKKYVAKRIGKGYTAPLYGVWGSIEDIDWDKLPDSFVLKSNSMSDRMGVKIIKDKNAVDFESLKPLLKDWLDPWKTLTMSYCRAYRKVRPLILAEKFLDELECGVIDYKFYCFRGKPYCVYTSFSNTEFSTRTKISFYDLDWNLLDVRYGDHENCALERPKHLKEMTEMASVLSKDFPFVRVDFFDTEAQPYLSEMTFYPGGGYVPFVPDRFDRTLGDLFILPEDSTVTMRNRWYETLFSRILVRNNRSQ